MELECKIFGSGNKSVSCKVAIVAKSILQIDTVSLRRVCLLKIPLESIRVK